MAQNNPSSLSFDRSQPGRARSGTAFPRRRGRNSRNRIHRRISTPMPPARSGNFHRDTKRAIAEATPVLLLLRGDFGAAERALTALQKEGRTVAVSLKETGLHQIADQLRDPARLARFLRIVNQADACIAPTPEAADFYRAIRGSPDRVAFIPTPYPIDDRRWDFSRPIGERSGIFIGTREWKVLSRNHLGALLVARQLERADRRTSHGLQFRWPQRRAFARRNRIRFRKTARARSKDFPTLITFGKSPGIKSSSSSIPVLFRARSRATRCSAAFLASAGTARSIVSLFRKAAASRVPSTTSEKSRCVCSRTNRITRKASPSMETAASQRLAFKVVAEELRLFSGRELSADGSTDSSTAQAQHALLACWDSSDPPRSEYSRSCRPSLRHR